MAPDPQTAPDPQNAPEGTDTPTRAPFRAADILDRVADAFLVVDREWRIVYANRQACRINQKPLGEFVGKIHWEEWPAAVGTELERQYRRAMDERTEVHFEHRYVAEPYDVWLEIDAYPTEDGLSIFYRDISARKRAAEDLRRSREDLRMAVDAAQIGTFYCDYPLDKIVWNETCKAHFFLPPDAQVDFALFYSLLHPDDHEPTRRAIERALAERVPYDVEYRTLAPDGRTRWVNAVGRFYYDADGAPTRFDGITLDISARQATEEALRASEERLQDVQARLEAALSAGEIATWTWDQGSDRVAADANLARLFSVPPEDAAGGRIDAFLQTLHPDDRLLVSQGFGDALARGDTYDIEFRVLPPDGGPVRRLAARGRVERDAEGRALGLAGVVVNITEQAERRRRERFLADLADRARGLTDPDAVIADAVNSVGEFLGVSRCIFADIDIEADTCTIRPDYRADPSSPSIEGVVSISSFGSFVVTEYAARRAVAVDDVRLDPIKAPPESIAAYEAIGIRAHVTVPVVHSGRVVSCMSVHNSAPRHWETEEIALLRTVVERTWLTIEVLRQQRSLVREAEERREAHEHTTRILESITDAFFTLDREWRFTYINSQAERVLFRAREELLGGSIWEMFPEAVGSTFDRQYRRAVTEGLPVSFEEFYHPLSTWFDVRAYPSADGLSVFFQNVNERKMAEGERERLLSEQSARAEREALLNRIGQSLRGSPDPDAVQEAAVSLLGEALGADRCYFAVYDLGRGAVSVARDWRRTGLPSIQGVYPFQNTVEMFRELYQESNTSVIGDSRTAPLSAQTRANMEGLGLRSRVSVALVEADGLMATLTAAMTDGPREWSADEVTLIEAVATQMRAAVEMARVAQREHAIASQLQEALQPALPGAVPGLALSSYYRPALAQSEGVGGDFFDVFAIEKGCTALVVGDLSGKGLAAAAQVATVRNMLRAFLYSQPTVAEAVTSLNRVLAENNLLTGFTTLFVGAFDGASGVLNYVNCGQEPALVRRARTGAVEQLVSTGPILGAIEGAWYEASRVTLSPGDALAVFTDGLTEVGASRTDMLGAEGLSTLLAEPVVREGGRDSDPEAEALARRLIAGVDAFAQTGARDDMCLLVGVVEGR